VTALCVGVRRLAFGGVANGSGDCPVTTCRSVAQRQNSSEAAGSAYHKPQLPPGDGVIPRHCTGKSAYEAHRTYRTNRTYEGVPGRDQTLN
jgi:hypothetical protein